MTPNAALQVLSIGTRDQSGTRADHGTILDALETLKVAAGDKLDQEVPIGLMVRLPPPPPAPAENKEGGK